MTTDPEYTSTWSDETRYLYDERIAILTDGKLPTAEQEQIARQQARAAHVLEVSAKASENIGVPCNADLMKGTK